MQLQQIENALIEKIKALLARMCQPEISVASGPGEWSGSYIDKVLKNPAGLPAAIWVSFEAANLEPDDQSRRVEAGWDVIVMVGFDGEAIEARRIQAMNLVELIVADLHYSDLGVDGRLADTGVNAIDNYWSGDLERVQVTVFRIGLTVTFNLNKGEPDPDCPQPELNDFLRAGLIDDPDGDGAGLGPETEFDVREGED